MADRGDVGRVIGFMGIEIQTRAPYQSTEYTTNEALLEDATAGATIHVMDERGGRLDWVIANGSGEATFYDLDTGTYYASEVGSTNAWQIEVTGGVATVTPLSSGGGGTRAFAFA